MTTAMRTQFSKLPTNKRSPSDTNNDNDTAASIDSRGSKGRQR